jgi:lipopolysaccharide export system protein LptA
MIDGYGNPATFYQMQDNGKPVKGRASKMHYELAKDFVVLTGNAYLEQLDSNITGDKITYLVKEQKCRPSAIKANASPPFWFRRSCRTKNGPASKRRVTNSLWQH